MYDPEIHHRRSIRLRGYDYSASGFYFITVCVQHKEPLLGEIIAGAMTLNDVGRLVTDVWQQLPQRYPNVDLDEYVVMPNHIHGIIVINNADTVVGADPCVCPVPKFKTCSEKPGGHAGLGMPGGHTGPGMPGGHTGPEKQGGHTGPERLGGHTGPPLPRVIQWFKTMTTNRYIHGVKHRNWAPFPGRFWQRNYYERIIRNETELHNIRQYIRDNPQNWQSDSENRTERPW